MRPRPLRRQAALAWLVWMLPAAAWAVEPATPATPGPSAPLTLGDCYALALTRSETIAIQGELIKETEARFLQAFSGVLPHASFVLTQKRQDGSGDSAFTLRNIPERKFTFSQPLFSGFKEFAAMLGARSERRERLQEKTRAEQLLLVDVADAFYLLREQREDLAILEATRTALVQRLDGLTQREQLGRSRPSERVSAEARLRRVLAEIELVRGQEEAAQELLAFLIGREPAEGIADPDLSLAPLDEEAVYLGRAAARPDVLAAEAAWRVAKKQVAVAQAEFWPDVDVESNYYTERVGNAKDIDWDVLLTVDVPIFQGGQVLGAVKQAVSQERQAKLALSRAKREAVLDVRDAYARTRAATEHTGALDRAREAAEENYRLQREEYGLNLVNNLDVLQALQELQDARRDAIHARYDAKRLYWQLRVAAGESLSR